MEFHLTIPINYMYYYHIPHYLISHEVLEESCLAPKAVLD